MSPAFSREYAGVVFDLDGTLYRQSPLRRRMVVELALSPLRSGPLEAARSMRILKVFRQVREELRELGRPVVSLADLQYRTPAERLGADPGHVRRVVEDWMFDRPLRHLLPCRRHGTVELLEQLRACGLRLGVFSDYPPDSKLAALGLEGMFDVTMSAVDPSINAFKPHPRGFEASAQALGLDPGDVLYVGDRADVDGEGARAAGMACSLLGVDKRSGVEDWGEVRSALSL